MKTMMKLTISINDAGIMYNSQLDLDTTKDRGTELPDGKIVRGLGTSFKSKADKERYERLTSRSNSIRSEFNKKFVRGPFDGTYLVPKSGDGVAFVAQYSTDMPDIDVSVFEFDFNLLTSPEGKGLRDWEERLGSQFKQYPLGRGKDIDGDALSAIEDLAKCPVLSAETTARILSMVAEVRIGKMNRVEFKRSIGLLNVEVNSSSLVVSRGTLVAKE